MPGNCDTQVRKIEEYIKISNKKSKAGNIASSLNKWNFNIKPALPKYNFTWDIGIVITYISKIDTNSLKYQKSKASYTVGLTV